MTRHDFLQRAGSCATSERSRLAGYARVLLAILLVWLGYLSLYPFVFVGSATEYWEQLWLGIIEPFATVGMFKHVVAFLLVGMLLVWASGRDNETVLLLRQILIILLVGNIIVELVQAGIPRRHCRFGDVAIHTGAGMVGACLAVLCMRMRPLMQLSVRSIGAAPAALVIGAVLASMLLVATSAGYAASLSNWRDDFSLVLGNETSGDRPWSGRLYGVAVYPAALSAAEVGELAATPLHHSEGLELRRALGAVVLVPFDERGGSIVRCAANGIDGLSFSIEPPSAASWLPDEAGLSFNGTGAVESTSPPKQLAALLRDANEFSVEVLAATDDLTQDGPARLVSFSSSVSHRNFTIAQDGSQLVMRVRTPLNGRNGSRLPGTWDGVFSTTDRLHMITTYDGALMQAYVDGDEQSPAQSLQSAGAVLGLGPHMVAFGAAVLYFVPIGLAMAACTYGMATLRRTAMAVVVAIVPVTSAMIAAWYLWSRPIESQLVIAGIPATVAGSVLGHALLRRVWN